MTGSHTKSKSFPGFSLMPWGVIMEVTKDIIDGPYCKMIPISLKYMRSNSKTKLFLYRSNLKIEKLFVKNFFYKLKLL